ncbi:adenosine kinase [Nanoarchaeota archaeon]
MHEVYGIGNPLMDVLVELDHPDLEEHKLEKGTFNLVDENRVLDIEEGISGAKIMPGGSVANTVAMFALLGGKAAFCGKVGDDETAVEYGKQMEEVGVKVHLRQADAATGRAITFITPDQDRTFAVHLGAALHLSKDDIDEEEIKNSKIVHVGGYVLEEPGLREAVLHALKIAKENGVRVSIDVADPALVRRCRDDMKQIVEEYADIVFANEEEAQELTGLEDPYEACNELAKTCQIAVVKMGKNGSVIRDGNEVASVDPVVVHAVDTTGAGDAYAAAFLFAITKGHDIEIAGNLGSHVSAKVVERIGARLPKAPEVGHIFEP